MVLIQPAQFSHAFGPASNPGHASTVIAQVLCSSHTFAVRLGHDSGLDGSGKEPVVLAQCLNGWPCGLTPPGLWALILVPNFER